VRDSPYRMLGEDETWDTTEVEPGDYTLFVDAYASANGEPTNTRAIPFSVKQQGSDEPADPSAPAQGWTEFDPAQADRIVYVSSSEGDDSNDGLSKGSPVRTVGRGKSLLRNGRADWLLFKRGDVFESGLGSWSLSGASTDRKMVIGAYGQGPRPEFHPHGHKFLDIKRIEHVAFVSLHARATESDPNHPDFNGGGGDKPNGVRWYGSGGDVRFEDFMIEYFANNMVIQSQDKSDRITGVTLYRCIVRYSYADDFGRNGLFGDWLADVTLRENVFYHNAWSQRVAGHERVMFGHNVYLNGTHDLTVVGNISGFASLNGFNLRTGNKAGDDQRNVTVRNNVMIGNGNGINARAKPNKSTISRNLTIENNVIAQHGASIPLGGTDTTVAHGITVSNWYGADVRDNLILRAPEGGGVQALRLQTYQRPESRNVTFENNVVHDWGRNKTELNKSGVTLSNNAIGLDPSRYVDADRSMYGYINANSGASSLRGFMVKASEMRKGDWNPALTAGPIVEYMQTGFERQ